MNDVGNTRKHFSTGHSREIQTKVFPNSYSKLANLKETSGKPVIQKSSKKSLVNQDRLRGRNMNTPSNFNIPRFDSCRNSGKRPISVGSNNFRPAFLEPEVNPTHYPNKSALIGLPTYKRNPEDHDSYRFPLFRSKQIKGFRLSISPDGSDSEQSFMYVKTPVSAFEVKGHNKVPYSAVNKGIKAFEYSSGPYGLKFDQNLLRAN
jgi:hypothetical protein